MSDIHKQVLEFLAEEVDLAPDDLTAETSLVNSGLVDSMVVLNMVQFIEETFDLELEAEQVTVENFDSVAAIVALVKSKVS